MDGKGLILISKLETILYRQSKIKESSSQNPAGRRQLAAGSEKSSSAA
jgi:hypothetical protein